RCDIEDGGFRARAEIHCGWAYRVGGRGNPNGVQCLDSGSGFGSAATCDGISTGRMRAAMIKEHERIVLKTSVPEEGLEAGDVGTVVHVYRDGQAYEVEFVALDGHTAAVVTLEASEVRPVSHREITHAREVRVAS